MDFLGTCVWIWEIMVLFMLPLMSALLAAIYLIAISKALNITIGKFIKQTFQKMNNMLKGW